MNDRTFTVTEDHIKLLPHLWFGYDAYTEFGAPEVDPKRPYGNSDVYGDIAELLEIQGNEDSWGDIEFTTEQRSYMLRVHRDMETVLNIMVRNNGVEPGVYKASIYSQNWSRA
jgi:hypothetical protein